jgi:hypothetical protein
MGVTHDLTLLNIAIFFKHLGHLSFGKLWVDTCDKEVGSRVDSTIIVVPGSRHVLHVAVTMAAG